MSNRRKSLLRGKVGYSIAGPVVPIRWASYNHKKGPARCATRTTLVGCSQGPHKCILCCTVGLYRTRSRLVCYLRDGYWECPKKLWWHCLWKISMSVLLLVLCRFYSRKVNWCIALVRMAWFELQVSPRGADDWQSSFTHKFWPWVLGCSPPVAALRTPLLLTKMGLLDT